MRALAGALVILALGTACARTNPYEQKADRITRAVMQNDLRPVLGDLAPSVSGLTLVRVAEMSHELARQGAYEGLVPLRTACPRGSRCFTARFTKRSYLETMRVGANGKVEAWRMQAERRPT